MVRQMEKMEWKEDVVKSYRADKNYVDCQITPYDYSWSDAKGHDVIEHVWKLTATRSLHLVYGTGDPITVDDLRSIEFIEGKTKVAYITITAERILDDPDEAKAEAEELSSLLEHGWKITFRTEKECDCNDR